MSAGEVLFAEGEAGYDFFVVEGSMAVSLVHQGLAVV